MTGHQLADQTTDKHELNALEGNNNTNTQTVNKLTRDSKQEL